MFIASAMNDYSNLCVAVSNRVGMHQSKPGLCIYIEPEVGPSGASISLKIALQSKCLTLRSSINEA